LADLERRNGELSAQISQLEEQVKALEEEKAEFSIKLENMDSIIVQHEETLKRNEVELLNKRRIEREAKLLRLELNKDKEGLEALEEEISNLTIKLQDANELVKQLEDERAELEARNADFNALNDRFVEISDKYLDIVAEREELTQTIRALRK